ncbi:lysine--tRNA ligase [Flavobacteriaceae bacterium]|jgi:lysyl-tRNA synthetase class 2|nr:MAG: lysine--tRNA ligase [Polaribacter sp. BACL8 MAG-120419-bin8]MBT4840701.1 lysine--tRNA ligase [Flavobacteriaceae bacterium]MDB4023505.1 lysine--tRNA ligase [bacterium]MBT5585776.1 lysine--tRNA ligase [Flavobacteriaceae bacterium]MCO4779892.1 lysine--tRNA ligase [Flavobacteriaceae bacterium]|tara:strand:+ start:2152 stop:3846 length:1695 start_codon:yes stop_codon:yes gene_type:complete
MQLTEQEIVRREKLVKLRALGIDPYPAALYPVNTMSTAIEKDYKEGKQVIVSGRLMRKKVQGKASFAEIQDSEGRIQVYFNRDEIDTTPDSQQYNEVFKKLIDLGDILGIEGTLFTTQVGEKTVLVKKFTLLSKALRPLPLPKVDADGKVHDEFNDPELRYRQRYVDLIVNPQVKDTFIKRTKITNSIRKFFNDKGYLEVETPILQPIPGGASARPFITHHNALNMPLYLRVANELYLKRLIVGGFDGVYEFSKDFRNEGMDRTHNPEFTVMELYVAYKDYHWMMDTTEKLLETIAMESNGSSKITVGKNAIEFKAPYPRVPILEAIKIHTGHDVAGLNRNELAGVAKSLDIEVTDSMGVGKLIDEIFGERCEHHYVQPTFITDYPKEMSPLTKEHRSNPALTERFELMVNGKELANAYSELNDPIDQRARFEDQLALSEKGDDEAMFIDQDFLRALEYGMPPTSGIGIGIDRLVMLMTNNASIQEVLFFPQMRPEKKAVELSENEKIVLELLKKTNPMPLLDLKEASGLSNKAWDKTIKSLTKIQMVVVAKEADALTCTLKDS